MNRRKKPKLLVVDDEPDNLDLLYRTFRRDFQVIKAENGLKALETLSHEGEVAVIISDQRMPEMKGTEFLSKTVPDFPDTIRIILTGFTDVEDLVEVHQLLAAIHTEKKQFAKSLDYMQKGLAYTLKQQDPIPIKTNPKISEIEDVHGAIQLLERKAKQ